MKFRNGLMSTVMSKSKVFSFLLLALALLSDSAKVQAQVQLTEIVSGEIVNSLKGTSLTRTTSSGGKSSLSFGANTTFGTSANINSTSGSKAESISDVKFKTGTLTTRLGGENDSVAADIGNIRANNMSSVDQDDSLTSISSDTNSYSNGNADISGILQSNAFEVDGANSTFSTKVSTVHGDNPEFDQITSENVSSDAQLASGSSGVMFSTTTDVDINTSDFVSSFQQAF